MDNKHSAQQKPGTNRTEDNYVKQVKNVSSQKELEEVAKAQLKERVKDQARDLARRNYTSSTGYGRTLMKGNRTNKETGETISRITHFARLLKEEIDKGLKTPGTTSDGVKQLVPMIQDLQTAKAINLSYGGKGSNAFEIISVICLKVLIDSFSVVTEGEIQQVPLKSRIMQRLGQQLLMQHLDAVAFIKSHEYDQEFINDAWKAKQKSLNYKGSIEQLQWLCERVSLADAVELEQMVEARREHLGIQSVSDLLDRYTVDSPPNLYQVQEGHRESRSNQRVPISTQR